MKTARVASFLIGLMTFGTPVRAQKPSTTGKPDVVTEKMSSLQQAVFTLQEESYPIANAKSGGMEKELARSMKLPAGEVHTLIGNGLKSADPLVQAQALLGLGEFPKADQSFDKALAGNKAAPKRLRLAYEGKGLIASARSDGTAALKHYQSALALYDRATEPLDRANCAAKVAKMLMFQRKTTEAEQFQREILRVREEKLGPKHPEVATALVDLSGGIQYISRPAEVEPLLRRALAIDEAAFGKDHPIVARDLFAIARTLLYMDREPGQPDGPLAVYARILLPVDRKKEVEVLFLRGTAIEEAAFGKDHPIVARNLYHRANLLLATNRRAESEPLLRRAIAIDEASFGKEHPIVASDLSVLAQVLVYTHREEEGERLMRRALAMDEASFGKNHPNVARDLRILSNLLSGNNDRKAEAEALQRRALAMDEATFGKDHPIVASDLNELADFLMLTDHQQEVESLLRRALAIDEAAFGKDHPNVVYRLDQLAGFLHQSVTGLPEWEEKMRRALAIEETTLGKSHPSVAVRLNDIANLLTITNRLQEAEPLRRRSLSIDEVALGKDHLTVSHELNELAMLLRVTGRPAEAVPLVKRRLEIIVKLGVSAGQPHGELEEATSFYRLIQEDVGETKETIDQKVEEILSPIKKKE